MPSKPASTQSAESAHPVRWALVPLRAFLGFTFCFAGLQKLANPGFFDAASPVSIQSQLAAAARRSPVHALISPLGHVAVLVGILIALGELAVGAGTLLGLWSRLAAAGGMVLSLMLFLTVSFHSAPYYTGADIVFVFAWTPLVLAGSGPVLSADAAIARWAEKQSRAARPVPPRAGGRQLATVQADRRAIVLKGMVTAAAAVAGLIVAGVAAGLGRLAGGTAKTAWVSSLPSTAAPRAAGTAVGSQGHVPSGTAIGPARDVPVGQAASFTDPATGGPSIVIQPRAGKFVAFDAVCPHAGCTVSYDPTAKLIVCPCHGSEFSASTGAVELGPAATGLTRITIAESRDGQLYVS
jgi:thiosulfate dehydrogenase (quinone) large subunit